MNVVEWVDNLNPIYYAFYVELSKTGLAMQLARQHQLWTRNGGKITDEGFDNYRSMLEQSGLSSGILAALTDTEISLLFDGFTIIVYEEIVRRESRYA